MKRFCSQFTFCSPEKILRQAVVEQNSSGVITDLFLLNDCSSESTHTLFVDGIVSSKIVSLQQQLSPQELHFVQNKYQYINLSIGISLNEMIPNNKKLILDFGTNSTDEINKTLHTSFPFLVRFSIFDILSACVYYPLLESQQRAELKFGTKTNLLQWKNIDLANKKITEKTKINYLH